MIHTESLAELTRLTTEYRKALRRLNQLERKPGTATAQDLLETQGLAKDLGAMLTAQARRMNRAVDTTTAHIVEAAPHLQEHPHLRKYAPLPIRQAPRFV